MSLTKISTTIIYLIILNARIFFTFVEKLACDKFTIFEDGKGVKIGPSSVNCPLNPVEIWSSFNFIMLRGLYKLVERCGEVVGGLIA